MLKKDKDKEDAGNATSGDFSLLTYNVAGLPAALNTTPNPELRMPQISKLINDYDVVLVQEDWFSAVTLEFNGMSYAVYHNLLAADDHHPFKSDPQPLPLGLNSARSSALVSDGLNEFSNFPFGDMTHVAWTTCNGMNGDPAQGEADCLAFKGFDVATHSLANGVDVDIYDLHGEAADTAQDLADRALDFQELATFINQHSVGRAIILAGDTNLRAAEAQVWTTFLTSTGLTDTCSVLDCGADATRLDRATFRNSDQLTLTPVSRQFEASKFVDSAGMALSDHDPLTVRFHWEVAAK
jgi:exonuclease III